VLLISLCTVQTAHNVTRPLDFRPLSIWPVFDQLRSSTPSLLLLPWSLSLPTMPHLSPAHHEKSKHVSPHNTDNMVEPPKLPGFKFKPGQVNYSSQIKSRYWPLSFSTSPLMSTLITQKHKVWILNLRHMKHSYNTKSQKSSRRSSRRRKEHKATNGTKSGKPRKKQRKAQTQKFPWNKLPLTLSVQALPLS
jgi:hypothetical protein